MKYLKYEEIRGTQEEVDALNTEGIASESESDDLPQDIDMGNYLDQEDLGMDVDVQQDGLEGETYKIDNPLVDTQIFELPMMNQEGPIQSFSQFEAEDETETESEIEVGIEDGGMKDIETAEFYGDMEKEEELEEFEEIAIIGESKIMTWKNYNESLEVINEWDSLNNYGKKIDYHIPKPLNIKLQIPVSVEKVKDIREELDRLNINASVETVLTHWMTKEVDSLYLKRPVDYQLMRIYFKENRDDLQDL